MTNPNFRDLSDAPGLGRLAADAREWVRLPRAGSLTVAYGHFARRLDTLLAGRPEAVRRAARERLLDLLTAPGAKADEAPARTDRRRLTRRERAV